VQPWRLMALGSGNNCGWRHYPPLQVVAVGALAQVLADVGAPLRCGGLVE
jgi:hypothetical protein